MLVDETRRAPLESVEVRARASTFRTRHDLILATKRFARDNTLRSWWHILSTTLLLLTAIGGALWNFHPAAKVVCGAVGGLLMLRLFVIYHDQQHHAILPKSRIAEGLMRVVGVLTLSPSSIWRSSHNHHHNHNSRLRGSQIGSFPIMTKEQYVKTPPGLRRRYLFVRHPLTILFGYVFMFIYGMCINPFLNYPRRHMDCLAALIIHVGIGATLFWFGGWQAWLLAQFLPHFIASAIGTYLFYAQHNFPSVTFSDNAGWTYEKAALESSSFLRTNRLMSWFTANIGYHHIHHLNSHIPFYRLPEVSREMPELQSPKTTSLAPAEIFRCLRLKVWDADAQRMVGVKNL